MLGCALTLCERVTLLVASLRRLTSSSATTSLSRSINIRIRSRDIRCVGVCAHAHTQIHILCAHASEPASSVVDFNGTCRDGLGNVRALVDIQC